MNAPTRRFYVFDSVWGVARKDAHRLYLSQSFRVADTGMFHEDALEYLKALKSGLGKQFGVQPEEIQLFSYGDYNIDEAGDPVVMAYLTVLDLRTGKIREIPRLGIAEIWSVGDTVFGSVAPSHCMDRSLGQWVVLANDPLEGRELTPKQLARATEGLKELSRYLHRASGRASDTRARTEEVSPGAYSQPRPPLLPPSGSLCPERA